MTRYAATLLRASLIATPIALSISCSLFGLDGQESGASKVECSSLGNVVLDIGVQRTVYFHDNLTPSTPQSCGDIDSIRHHEWLFYSPQEGAYEITVKSAADAAVWLVANPCAEGTALAAYSSSEAEEAVPFACTDRNDPPPPGAPVVVEYEVIRADLDVGPYLVVVMEVEAQLSSSNLYTIEVDYVGDDTGGDGDPTTGGDGDPTTGGDGDPTTGGDGDPTTGGDGLSCELQAACSVGDPVACVCEGCTPGDQTCGNDDDCVCAICTNENVCTTNCADDGVCDPYLEGCSCTDCMNHPECGPQP